MIDRFVLLTGEFDAGGYVALLDQLNPACRVDHVKDRAALLQVTADLKGHVRLLSFCSGTIVPRFILDRLDAPAYNIHPGPPDFPGSHPKCWAAYFGVTQFGATLHEMAARVDERAIIDTKLFPVCGDSGQREFGEKGYLAALELLRRWTPLLIGSDKPLPPNGERWKTRKWRRADRENKSQISLDIGLEELERRRRAFAELPPGRLTLSLGGLTFAYSPPLSAT